MQNHETSFAASLREGVPLAPLTTLGIGGAARYFIEATTNELLADAVRWARDQHLPVFVLGGGSNLVIADEGFHGLVIHNAIGGVTSSVCSGEAIISVGAGEAWSAFVNRCVAANFAGVECLTGIPGNVGATPIQNVGAYGQEVSETIVAVEAFDTEAQQSVEFAAADCEFGYRSSRFKTRDGGRFLVTRVRYRLAVGDAPAMRYPELQRYLYDAGVRNPSLVEVSKAVYEIRRRKAMVLSEDPDSRSVGSFFVNPVVTADECEALRARAARVVADIAAMPAFPTTDGRVKLSAAWLIERAGIHRGFVYGNVGTSTKHSLAIINRGGGTAREVKELAALIQTRVRDTFGIELMPEPRFIGFA